MYRLLQSCYILDGAMKNINLGTQKKQLKDIEIAFHF